jgi:hypothetical protein
VFTQKHEKIDLAFYLALAFDLVNPQEKPTLARFEQVVRIDRSFGNPIYTGDSAEVVIVRELFEECFVELSVCSHEGVSS